MLNNQSYLQDFGLFTELTSEESAAVSGGLRNKNAEGGYGENIGGAIGSATGTAAGTG